MKTITTYYLRKIINLLLLPKISFLVMVFLLATNSLWAQSGTWDGWREMSYDTHVTNGSGGYFDHGGGVIQLTNDVYSGCTASAVHNGAKYNHCTGNYSACYQVLFGCGEADGMAFSFSYGCNQTDNSWQVWGCGGGLGYRNGCAWNQGITIEFDTYNNTGGAGFDGAYAGAGLNDEIAIHRNLEATDAGRLTAVSVPDLEDGLEHNVCINYDRVTHVISVTIDGINRITYDLDAGGVNPDTYFSGCDLMTTWSAGTNSGLNMQAVSTGARIFDYAGKLCPQMLPIELLEVKAEMKSDYALVSWSTVSEINNEKFNIERSSDLVNWESIGELKGAENSSSVRNYNYSDYTPFEGVTYYRIKQTDFDGSFSYSKVVLVNNKSVAQFTVSPNCFDDIFTIKTDLRGELNIKIYDMLGKLVYHRNHACLDGMMTIQPDLQSGVYIVMAKTNEFNVQQTVVKK